MSHPSSDNKRLTYTHRKVSFLLLCALDIFSLISALFYFLKKLSLIHCLFRPISHSICLLLLVKGKTLISYHPATFRDQLPTMAEWSPSCKSKNL